jgi:hypothetical protein
VQFPELDERIVLRAKAPAGEPLATPSYHEEFIVTQLLEQALAEVQKLPQGDQDAIAALILDELADERRWDEAFSRSQDKLAQIAAKVRSDIRAGRVRSTGMDEL